MKEKKGKKVQLNARCEQSTIDKLGEFAQENNRTFSNYVDTVLKNHIEEIENKKTC